MKMKSFFALGIILVLFLSLSSCEKDENKTLVSQHNGNDSHKTDQNCMECHSSGGSGDGIFTIAGSIYDVDKVKKIC